MSHYVLGVKIGNLKQIYITPIRSVLFEKYNVKNSLKDFLWTQLDGCYIQTLPQYKNNIFYVKKGKCLFQKDLNNRSLYIRQDIVWSVLFNKFNRNHKKSQEFAQETMGFLLDIEGFFVNGSDLEFHGILDSYLSQNKRRIFFNNLKNKILKVFLGSRYNHGLLPRREE